MHIAVEARGLPVRVLVTSGTEADCSHALALIKGFAAQYLLADRGYDTNKIIKEALIESPSQIKDKGPTSKAAMLFHFRLFI